MAETFKGRIIDADTIGNNITGNTEAEMIRILEEMNRNQLSANEKSLRAYSGLASEVSKVVPPLIELGKMQLGGAVIDASIIGYSAYKGLKSIKAAKTVGQLSDISKSATTAINAADEAKALATREKALKSLKDMFKIEKESASLESFTTKNLEKQVQLEKQISKIRTEITDIKASWKTGTQAQMIEEIDKTRGMISKAKADRSALYDLLKNKGGEGNLFVDKRQISKGISSINSDIKKYYRTLAEQQNELSAARRTASANVDELIKAEVKHKDALALTRQELSAARRAAGLGPTSGLTTAQLRAESIKMFTQTPYLGSKEASATTNVATKVIKETAKNSNSIKELIRAIPLLGPKLVGKGIEDPALQRRLVAEAGGRIGGLAISAGSKGGLLGVLKTGALWTSGALGASALIGAMTTGPGKIAIGEAIEGLGSKIGNELTQGIGKAMQVQGMQQYSEMAAWLGFMAEDVFQPMTMQIQQATKAGQYETARDLTKGLRETILGFTSAKRSVEELQKEIAEKFGMEDAEALQIARGLLKAYDAQAKMMLQTVEVSIPQMIAASEKAKETQEAIFAGLDLTYEEGVQALINQERTLNALELKQKSVNIQTSIYNKLLKNAESTMGAITQARFVGQIGAEREIFAGQINAMKLQEEMMLNYGPTSTYGKALSAQKLTEFRSGFEGIAIQRRLLEHSKGTVMYETEAKALMELNKEQQKKSLDFQLAHKDEMIAFEEKKIKLDEANASVQLLQMQYELSFGAMRREIQLNVREIEDNYLKANDLLFNGTEDVNGAISKATTLYKVARENAEKYTSALGTLEGQTITLYSAMVKTINKIIELRGYDVNIGEATGGGGGRSSRVPTEPRGPSKTWADYSNADLFDMLRSGGSGAYGAATELKKRGFTPEEDSPYRDYFHSGGFITSDRIIAVQKGERVIAKEHAGSGEVTLIVNNTFTGVSMSDQESIGETISDSILNKLREAKGIV